MTDWLEDDWIKKAGIIGESFYDYHYTAMPESPNDVWDTVEFEYFIDSFVLWNAKVKFELRQRSALEERIKVFRENVKKSILYDLSQEHLFADGEARPNFDVYLEREGLYLRLLTKSSGSFFKSLTGSLLNDACASFLSYGCKRYIFSQRDLKKILSAWFLDKHVELQRSLNLN